MTKNKKVLFHDPDGNPMPTKHQLIKLLWIISPAFTRWAESHINENGMTPQRVRILVPLIENGPMMMSALKNEMGVSATNVTALVDALEKEKMVTRHPHATDRRVTIVSITPKAEKIMHDSYYKYFNSVGDLFSGVTPARQEKLLEALLEIRGALIGHGVLEERDIVDCADSKKRGG